MEAIVLLGLWSGDFSGDPATLELIIRRSRPWRVEMLLRCDSRVTSVPPVEEEPSHSRVPRFRSCPFTFDDTTHIKGSIASARRTLSRPLKWSLRPLHRFSRHQETAGVAIPLERCHLWRPRTCRMRYCWGLSAERVERRWLPLGSSFLSVAIQL